MPGVCGNPKGRPTNARLRAKLAATDRYVELKRAASYAGLTPEHFVRLARVAYGRSWQKQLAADLGMSVRGVIRWAKGEYKISHDKEMLLLTVCLRRVRAAHALVRAMYRRAAAAERAREELARCRYKTLTAPEEQQTVGPSFHRGKIVVRYRPLGGGS
jgi:hypothetical protein